MVVLFDSAGTTTSNTSTNSNITILYFFVKRRGLSSILAVLPETRTLDSSTRNGDLRD